MATTSPHANAPMNSRLPAIVFCTITSSSLHTLMCVLMPTPGSLTPSRLFQLIVLDRHQDRRERFTELRFELVIP